MKKYLFILVAVLVTASCGSCSNNTPKDEESQQLCGGYTQQRDITKDEMDMFCQVMGSNASIYTPLSVSTQVVAGTNYKFWCRFSDKANGLTSHCWIVIYKDLTGAATLTNITVTD